jgi:SAM-dependent methyltransferase
VYTDFPMTHPTTLRIRLIVLTFLMLFVELALIRWLGGNVLYLSYFSNIVLLGSFLGIGLGFLWAARSEFSLLRFMPLVLTALVLLVHFFPIRVEAVGSDVIFFGAELRPTGPPRELMLPAIFLAVAAILMCVGDAIGRTFRQLANLDAYQFDLIGSLIGIVIFTVLAFIGAQPIVWGTVVAIVIVWATRPKKLHIPLIGVPIIVLLGVLAVESSKDGVIWTPYYKAEHTVPPKDDMWLFVNGTPHWQFVEDGDSPIYKPLYDRLADDDLGDVLIIGSGSGNDVAVALAKGARSIDAVEIDPKPLELAKKYHPNRPYDDPRVTLHVDDGRAFLEGSNKKWDLTVLALPDSLTLVQGASAVRLESFLFTREAATSYREHLTDDGVFSMYNLYRENWLVDRYAATLEDAFGHAPCVTRPSPSSTVLTIGVRPELVNCPTEDQWVRPAGTPDPVSDDRPFPYLKTASIPTFYVVALALILIATFVSVRVIGGPMRGITRFADLFFMGVAFLLLETKNVVQFALLFGTTWLVNAMVFGGVMLAVLLAVIVSKRIRIRNLALLYGLLAVSILVSWLIPRASLLGLPFIPRLVIAVVLAFLPIFIANLVFAQRFRDTNDALTAFSANLLGAMVGGLLEYTSMVLGYRNLLLVALVAYGLAFVSGRRHLTSPAAT